MIKPKVFVSHISTEKELARYLKDRLVSDFLGLLDVFVSSDGKAIQAGDQWLTELSAALAAAQVEIILCSRESVGRPWVNFEAGAGWVRGIQIIPVCHSGMTPGGLPLPLNMLQGIEASQPEGLQALYESIAGLLEMQVPKSDFKAMAREIEELEKKYRQVSQGLERIEHPRILCAASEQYAKDMDFELDSAALEAAFPRQVVVERRLTSKRLRDLLTTEKFDIIHLAIPVDQENGDLLFSPVGSAHVPITSKVDMMSAEAFAELVVESKTRLVVLATCYALYLAVEIARITNIVATKVVVTGEAVAEWSECFYGLLAKGYSLHRAYEITALNSRLPMKLVRHRDVAFSLDASSR